MLPDIWREPGWLPQDARELISIIIILAWPTHTHISRKRDRPVGMEEANDSEVIK